jgi:hypothetical protein
MSAIFSAASLCAACSLQMDVDLLEFFDPFIRPVLILRSSCIAYGQSTTEQFMTVKVQFSGFTTAIGDPPHASGEDLEHAFGRQS